MSIQCDRGAATDSSQLSRASRPSPVAADVVLAIAMVDDQLRFPYAVAIHETADDDRVMAVADTANNRILLWDGVPDGSTAAADRVLGQPTFGTSRSPTRGTTG